MINGFLINQEHVTFFNGPMYISCMGWEVKIDMSGQLNVCLRICNVKMKKKITGTETGHISENLQVMACRVKQFELIFQKF